MVNAGERTAGYTTVSAFEKVTALPKAKPPLVRASARTGGVRRERALIAGATYVLTAALTQLMLRLMESL
jgi:hypothetical protein